MNRASKTIVQLFNFIFLIAFAIVLLNTVFSNSTTYLTFSAWRILIVIICYGFMIWGIQKIWKPRHSKKIIMIACIIIVLLQLLVV